MREALGPLRGSAHPLYSVRAIEAFGELAAGLGLHREAALLLAFAEERRREKRLSRPHPVQARFDRARENSATALCDAFDSAWDEGRSLDDAAAFAIAQGLLTARNR